MLLAAELVAFDILEPALRSRGGITNEARQLYGDAEFKAGSFEGGIAWVKVVDELGYIDKTGKYI